MIRPPHRPRLNAPDASPNATHSTGHSLARKLRDLRTTLQLMAGALGEAGRDTAVASLREGGEFPDYLLGTYFASIPEPRPRRR